MIARAVRGARLGYLVGRAIAHILLSDTNPIPYCPACNSAMELDGRRQIRIIAHGEPCPVHVAWRALLRGAT